MRLSDAVRALREAGVPDAAYDARVIFSEIGGIGRAEMMFSDPSVDSERLDDAVRRRSGREPLQYIIGKVAFYHEEYEVGPDCLIPRADTEILVDYAVHNIPSGESFADLCCGSGCVGISTLCATDNTFATLVDISEGALSFAKRNAERNGVLERVTFIQADVLSKKPICGEIFAVLANPPYVTYEAYERLEKEIYFEPKIAFVGGDDGMDFYRAITEAYQNSLKPEGFIAFEIGFDQRNAICSVADDFGFCAEIIKDFSGNDRVAVLKKK